jgi:hypothetical protein
MAFKFEPEVSEEEFLLRMAGMRQENDDTSMKTAFVLLMFLPCDLSA